MTTAVQDPPLRPPGQAAPAGGVLDTWPAPAGDSVVSIETTELTALCPLTRQPDFYTLRVRYRPGRRIVESKSVKLYLAGFRDRVIGVEALAAEIRDALTEAAMPAALTVELTQGVRGGLTFTAQTHTGGGVLRG